MRKIIGRKKRQVFLPETIFAPKVKIEKFETQGGPYLLVQKDENPGIWRGRGSEETMTGPKADKDGLKNAS